PCRVENSYPRFPEEEWAAELRYTAFGHGFPRIRAAHQGRLECGDALLRRFGFCAFEDKKREKSGRAKGTAARHKLRPAQLRGPFLPPSRPFAIVVEVAPLHVRVLAEDEPAHVVLRALALPHELEERLAGLADFLDLVLVAPVFLDVAQQVADVHQGE